MEVSAVPSNRNYPEGGDYGNRAPNMSYVATANDPRGDYYSSPPRGQNYDYPQRQYLPHEREFVASHGSCSHCQTHCCQRPTEYVNQPTGSRGERLERYVGTVLNEPAPVATQAVQEVRSTHSFSNQSIAPQSGPAHSQVENPQTIESAENVHAPSPPSQAVESSSIPYQQPVDRPTYSQDATSSSHHEEQCYTNDSCHYQTVNGTSPCVPSQMESPFLGEGRTIEPICSDMPQPGPSESSVTPCNQTSNAPVLNPVQAMPPSADSRGTIQDSVASLMVPSTPNPSRIPAEVECQRFNPASLTHLNFKEKQLAMSAVKKAAANMNCVGMFQDKDKQKSGIIGRRDFQIVMDRVGVLRGMSSREIDAVFKGFATQSDTEIDYKKFTAACRHAIDNDHRLARMAQK